MYFLSDPDIEVPENVGVSGFSHETITLTWDEVSEPDANYSIRYYEDGQPSMTLRVDLQQRMTVSSLEPTTFYRLSVAAIIDDFIGNYSEEILQYTRKYYANNHGTITTSQK